jgi:hypothetical protein
METALKAQHHLHNKSWHLDQRKHRHGAITVLGHLECPESITLYLVYVNSVFSTRVFKERGRSGRTVIATRGVTRE